MKVTDGDMSWELDMECKGNKIPNSYSKLVQGIFALLFMAFVFILEVFGLRGPFSGDGRAQIPW